MKKKRFNLKNRLVILFLFTLFLSGCSSKPNDSPPYISQQMQLMKEKESQKKYAEVVDLAIEELNGCQGKLSDDCLVYLNFLWFDGAMLLYELDGLGDYDVFGLRAKQLVEINNEKYSDYQRLVQDMVLSKHPWITGKDKLISIRNNPWGHLAIYYALSGQIDLAREYADKFKQEAPIDAGSVSNLVRSLEAIYADKDKRAMTQTLLAMRIPLSCIAGIVDSYWPVFQAFQISNMGQFFKSRQGLLTDLKVIQEAIYNVLQSSGAIVVMDIIDSEAKKVLQEMYQGKNFISEKDPVSNLFKCSFASTIGNIIARSKRLDMQVIITHDKVTFDRLARSVMGVTQPPSKKNVRPNHVLNLLKINDNLYRFIDFTNCWASEPFNLQDIYYKQGDFYELILPGTRDDLYGHFIVVPEKSLRGMLYDVFAAALNQSGHKGQSYMFYNKALYFWPNDFGAYAALAGNISEQDKSVNPLVMDINTLNKSLSIYPKNSGVYNQLGFHYYGAKDYVKGADAFKKAIELDPGDFLSLRMLGEGQLSLGQYQDAIQSFRKSIALAPDFAEAYKGLGRAYYLTNDLLQSEQVLRKSLEIFNSNNDVDGAKSVNDILQKVSR
ncbi:MAG: tetratricopeptide repeat protein [Candidatus Omnitrophota bacterium]